VRPIYHELVVTILRLFAISLLAIVASSCGAQTAIDPDADNDADSSGVTYGAVGFATALERFAVFKRDTTNDRCTVVVFVFPMDGPTPGVELPDRWAVQTAWRGSGTACDNVEINAPSGASAATALSGRGSWDEALCTVEVDLRLEFGPEPEEVLRAEGIELAWGGCD
jgi:hypothetical protein